MSAGTWTYTDLAEACGNASRQADGSYKAQCPVPSHKDAIASLHISPGRTRKVVVRCGAKCDQAQVYEHCLALMDGRGKYVAPVLAAPVALMSVMPAPNVPSSFNHREFGNPSRIYEYQNRDGQVMFYNCRFEFDPPHYKEGRKTTRPYTYKKKVESVNGRWGFGAPDRYERTLYRLQYLKAIGAVLISEGEKAADAAAVLLPEISHIAWWGGASNWKYNDWMPLAGRIVWLLPDADKPTEENPHGASVASMDELKKLLEGLGCTVHYARNVHDALRHFVTVPEDFKGFDAADALELGWGREEFIAYLDAANVANPARDISAVQDLQAPVQDLHLQNAHGDMQILHEALQNAHGGLQSLHENVQILHVEPQTNANPAQNTLNEAFPVQDLQNSVQDLQTDAAKIDDAVQNFQATMVAGLAKQTDLASKFISVGYNKDTYYYLSRATKQIHELTSQAHKRATLISICPQEVFWEGYVPAGNKGPNWDQITARMIDDCHAVGLFNPDNIRGRGAWYDSGKSVLHLGNRLIIDGEEKDILTRPGKFIYELSPTLEGPGESIMDDTEAAEIMDICRQFSWAQEISAEYLVGWVALAPICGAVQWRPHVWITGAKGTGKSTIEKDFVTPLLGNMAIVAQGNSSEAGIRQTLGHDALPVIIDESESEDERGRVKANAIIEMMRQASSDSAAQTFKGGSDGKPQTFHIRSMFLLASIGVSIKRAADQSRITKVSLVKSERDWRNLETRIAAINHDTSRRMIARTVSLIPVIRFNARLLADKIKELTGDQRLGDQYGALLAGAVAMTHCRKMTDDEATEFVVERAHEFQRQADAVEHDESQCLDYLLQQTIRMDRSTGAPVTLSVAELVNICVRGHPVHNQGDADMALRRHGLKTGARETTLKIAQSHSQLEGLFKGTPWQNGWCQFIIRIPGAHVAQSMNGKDAKVRFAGGSPCRSIEVPLSLITGDITDETDTQDTIPF